MSPAPLPTPSLEIVANTIPPTVATQVTVVNTETPLQPVTLIPTASDTPTVRATSPLATPTPTLSLAELLSQIVVITVTDVISVPTTVVYPKPPIAEQPALGPAPITTHVPQTQTTTITATAPTFQLGSGLLTARVPILMYHYLSTPPANADIYRRDLSVPPELFAAQLDRIQSEGYTTISLYDLVAHLLEGAALPPKPVILTFDDGYRDNYENAYPLLRERQMTATFFLVIDFINRERPEYLTWDMVREMHAGGMSIEVHGVDHTTLRNRSRADLEFQALRSYETVQDRIGVRPRFLSYPAGEYDAATIEVFQSANYWAGATTVQGATHNSDQLFELRRVRIRNSTTPDELVRLLALDW